MKNLIFIFSFLIITTGTSFAVIYNAPPSPVDTSSSFLEIINRRNNRVTVISVGKMITIWSKGNKFRGRVTKVTATHIYVNNYPFNTNEIHKIKAKILAYTIIGPAIMLWGGIYTANGVSAIQFIGQYDVTAVAVILTIAVGVAIIYWGYDVFSGKEYRYRKWKFKGKVLNNNNNNNDGINFINE